MRVNWHADGPDALIFADLLHRFYRFLFSSIGSIRGISPHFVSQITGHPRLWSKWLKCLVYEIQLTHFVRPGVRFREDAVPEMGNLRVG
jgi:hypothetical protein